MIWVDIWCLVAWQITNRWYLLVFRTLYLLVTMTCHLPLYIGKACCNFTTIQASKSPALLRHITVQSLYCCRNLLAQLGMFGQFLQRTLLLYLPITLSAFLGCNKLEVASIVLLTTVHSVITLNDNKSRDCFWGGQHSYSALFPAPPLYH